MTEEKKAADTRVIEVAEKNNPEGQKLVEVRMQTFREKNTS